MSYDASLFGAPKPKVEVKPLPSKKETMRLITMDEVYGPPGTLPPARPKMEDPKGPPPKAKPGLSRPPSPRREDEDDDEPSTVTLREEVATLTDDVERLRTELAVATKRAKGAEDSLAKMRSLATEWEEYANTQKAKAKRLEDEKKGLAPRLSAIEPTASVDQKEMAELRQKLVDQTKDLADSKEREQRFVADKEQRVATNITLDIENQGLRTEALKLAKDLQQHDRDLIKEKALTARLIEEESVLKEERNKAEAALRRVTSEYEKAAHRSDSDDDDGNASSTRTNPVVVVVVDDNDNVKPVRSSDKPEDSDVVGDIKEEERIEPLRIVQPQRGRRRGGPNTRTAEQIKKGIAQLRAANPFGSATKDTGNLAGFVSFYKLNSDRALSSPYDNNSNSSVDMLSVCKDTWEHYRLFDLAAYLAPYKGRYDTTCPPIEAEIVISGLALKVFFVYMCADMTERVGTKGLAKWDEARTILSEHRLDVKLPVLSLARAPNATFKSFLFNVTHSRLRTDIDSLCDSALIPHEVTSQNRDSIASMRYEGPVPSTRRTFEYVCSSMNVHADIAKEIVACTNSISALEKLDFIEAALMDRYVYDKIKNPVDLNRYVLSIVSLICHNIRLTALLGCMASVCNFRFDALCDSIAEQRGKYIDMFYYLAINVSDKHDIKSVFESWPSPVPDYFLPVWYYMTGLRSYQNLGLLEGWAKLAQKTIDPSDATVRLYAKMCGLLALNRFANPGPYATTMQEMREMLGVDRGIAFDGM